MTHLPNNLSESSSNPQAESMTPAEITQYLQILAEGFGVLNQRIEELRTSARMSRHLFHWPLDFEKETSPPIFDPAVWIEGEPLPVPPDDIRAGYAPGNAEDYLAWGRLDHDLLIAEISKHRGISRDMSILDFGCSSGRVLRHFSHEHRTLGWKLYGIDIEARLVEWIRQNFPPEFCVCTGTLIPHLPFRDASLDVIFGISVFTHTKYLWDQWLCEFRRVLKPEGLCIQSIQCSRAWSFYHENREAPWVANGHPQSMLSQPNIDRDFFFYGDADVSQTFYKDEVAKRYFGRYLELVDLLPPPKRSYQDWIILRNRE